MEYREKIHKGPMYSVLGENYRVTKPGERPSKPAASFNAFEGMPRYSQRFSKLEQNIPKLKIRLFGSFCHYLGYLEY